MARGLPISDKSLQWSLASRISIPLPSPPMQRTPLPSPLLMHGVGDCLDEAWTLASWPVLQENPNSKTNQRILPLHRSCGWQLKNERNRHRAAVTTTVGAYNHVKIMAESRQREKI